MSGVPKACVIGWPVAHSLSPTVHRHWLKRYGIAGEYDIRPVPPEEIEAFLGEFASHGLVGCNVTIPHKEAACRMADNASDLASKLGAANTLWLEDGRLMADNTDVHGFLANLDAGAPGWESAGSALVIGAGGSARAIIAGLIERGVDRVVIANRTAERAETLAERFAGDHGTDLKAVPLDALDACLGEAELIVNTTSAGMSGADPLPIDWSRARPPAIATDIVYVPLITPFLSGAGDAGLTIVDGLGMLLHQAVPGFEKWFGRRPEVDADMRHHVLEAMAARG
jgi:shikimate dehydrogenase